MAYGQKPMKHDDWCSDNFKKSIMETNGELQQQIREKGNKKNMIFCKITEGTNTGLKASC